MKVNPKVYCMLVSFAMAMIPNLVAIAADCQTVCDARGSCSSECSSEAPAVTRPPTQLDPPGAGFNSCRHAFDGACDDVSYRHAISNSCTARTDEADCRRTIPSGSR